MTIGAIDRGTLVAYGPSPRLPDSDSPRETRNSFCHEISLNFKVRADLRHRMPAVSDVREGPDTLIHGFSLHSVRCPASKLRRVDAV